jgi:hypothetical protein
MFGDNPAALRRLLLISVLLPDRDRDALVFGLWSDARRPAVTNLPAKDRLVRTMTSADLL